MRKQAAMLPALLLFGAIPFFSQATQTTTTPAKPSPQQPVKPQAQPSAPPAATAQIVIPPDASKKINPVKANAQSLAEGKQRYTTDCLLCHGANGDGKTDLAKSMNLKVPDMTDPAALKSRSDGDLYYIIAKGTGSMPNEDERAKPAEIWNLVNYVRSLSQKKTAAKAK